MDLLSVWLPILVSSIAVFVASFLAWMVLPHHRSDWSKLPDEDGLISALSSGGVKPGQYMFPFCSGSREMKSPEFKA